MHSVKKRNWCVRRRLEGWRVADVCRHARVSRSSLHRWLRAVREGGWKALESRSTRPHTIRRVLTEEVRDRIRDLREAYGFDHRKLALLLREEGTVISATSVYRGLEGMGLLDRDHKPYQRHRYVRWERSRPNELWQMDTHVLAQDGPYLIAALDDYSRYLVDALVSERCTTAAVLYLLRRAVDRHGPPAEILTDNGIEFGHKGDKANVFDLWCRKTGVKHIRARVKSPTTLGKMERWWGTFEREAWRYLDLDHFLYTYNWVRPHQSLDYRRPADRYFETGWLYE